MKNIRFEKFATVFTIICAVIFGLTTLANAAVKPELITKALNGGGGNDTSNSISVSADGRYVVFDSNASNLVNGITDTNGSLDIFLRDTVSGTIRCLSCVPAANPTSTGNASSFSPIISPDGRYVVFGSAASDLLSGGDTNNARDIFRFDTQTNERVLVSSAVQSPIVTANGDSGNAGNGFPFDMSDDGRYVVFSSLASNLTNISDTNNKTDVFVRDMQSGVTRPVSLNAAGNATGNDISIDPSISSDGRLIAFTSSASNLVSVDGNAKKDVFLYNTQTQSTKCVSLSNAGNSATGSDDSFAAVISKDGNRIAYYTKARDLTNTPIPIANVFVNVVVYDVGFNQNALVSVNVNGNGGGNDSSGSSGATPALSINRNGRYVTFDSRATNLSNVTTQAGKLSVFRRDLLLGITEVVSVTPTGVGEAQDSFVGLRGSAISSDGRFITFVNAGNTLTDLPGNFNQQIYVRDMLNGITTALTLNNAGNGLGNSFSADPRINANGRTVFFGSSSTDLTPTSTNGFYNLFKATVPTPQRAVSDFDGDGKTDFAVWRPVNGTWYVLPNTGNYIASTIQWGANGDQIVPADFTGDGRTDYSVFRPSNGTWYITDTSNFGSQTIQFGQSGDRPVPADYDGDGKADIAVFRPSTGSWYIARSSGVAAQNFTTIQFGQSGDVPVTGDYDGDGKADIAVFRQSNGFWYILRSSNNQFQAVQYGISTDKLVPADYDGDGKTDIAVFRGGNFYILESRTGNNRAVNWGLSNDIPAVGDFDGDGLADISVFRPSNGNWYRLNSSNGQFQAIQFGQNGDSVVPAAYIQ